MNEKALEFRKDVYLSVFKAALTMLIIIFSAMVSAVYKLGYSSLPWELLGLVGLVADGLVLIWSAGKIFELANKLEEEK